MKYLKLRQKTQDQLSSEQLGYEVEDNKDQLEADLKETKRALSKAEQKAKGFRTSSFQQD